MAAQKEEKENQEREASRPDMPSRRGSNPWANVESVMRKERLDSKAKWQQEAEDRITAAEESRAAAEEVARCEIAARKQMQELAGKADDARVKAEERYAEARSRMKAAEAKYAQAKATCDEMSRRHGETLEIRDAFGEGGLESWPMFPGRKVCRVLGVDNFDGRVSQEFRVKDGENGERGVTFLMGRITGCPSTEVQAVLFDAKHMSDLDAARWWLSNKGRFEKAAARIEATQRRAASAQGGTRPRLA